MHSTPVHVTENLGRMNKPVAGAFPSVTTLIVETTAMNTELDFVILGAIQSSINCSDVSVSGRSEKHRKQLRMTFFYHSKRICRTTFLFLHCIGKNKFCSLLKRYKENGLSLRVHGNKKRPPSWTVPSQIAEQVVRFILNVAEKQALLLPRRVPGFKRTDVHLLPSALTKHRLWMTYTGICTSQGQQSVGYSKFCCVFLIRKFILITKHRYKLQFQRPSCITARMDVL